MMASRATTAADPTIAAAVDDADSSFNLREGAPL
jgi:hypothetical protein